MELVLLCTCQLFSILSDLFVQEDPPAGVSGAPGENNILLWNAVIFGPHDTPFEVRTLQMSCKFSIPKNQFEHASEIVVFPNGV